MIHVVVTGATSGIGLGLARRYTAAGARVITTGRDVRRLDALRHALPGVVTVTGDLAEPAARTELTEQVSALGGWDVLVNNAGVQRRVAIAADDAA